MTLSISDLASAINQALGPVTDKDGNPIAVTGEMTGYATAVVNTLKAAAFANASGTITGSAAPGAALTAGTGAGGLISAISSATWQIALSSSFPGADSGKLSAEAGASTSYLQSNAKIGFASGDITGTCTATALSPGILAAGAGSGGKASGLSGSAWASAVLSALGSPGPLASPVYTAVANYIMANAACAYASGDVTGTFSAGGGALAAGTGVSGQFS